MKITRTIFHCVEFHTPVTVAEAQRQNRAWETWAALIGPQFRTLRLEQYPRTAKSIGDSRALPYLKDVLRLGIEAAGPEDIIVFTNSDIHLNLELPKVLNLHLSIWGACTAHRAEFHGQIAKGSPEQWSEAGMKHMGRDLFAATKEWLTRNWDEVPDAILGAPMYDLHLAALVRHKVGHPTTRQNLEQVVVPAELPQGYISHEHHDPTWSRLPTTTPSHRHNQMLFKEWSMKNQPSIRWHPSGLI